MHIDGKVAYNDFHCDSGGLQVLKLLFLLLFLLLVSAGCSLLASVVCLTCLVTLEPLVIFRTLVGAHCGAVNLALSWIQVCPDRQFDLAGFERS